MMYQHFAAADDFLHYGDMTRAHLPGTGKCHHSTPFRGMATGIKPGRIIPPIATISPDGHTGRLADIGHAGNAARIAHRDTLGSGNGTARPLDGLIGPNWLACPD
jgi:hypothetical protein